MAGYRTVKVNLKRKIPLGAETREKEGTGWNSGWAFRQQPWWDTCKTTQLLSCSLDHEERCTSRRANKHNSVSLAKAGLKINVA